MRCEMLIYYDTSLKVLPKKQLPKKNDVETIHTSEFCHGKRYQARPPQEVKLEYGSDCSSGYDYQCHLIAFLFSNNADKAFALAVHRGAPGRSENKANGVNRVPSAIAVIGKRHLPLQHCAEIAGGLERQLREKTPLTFLISICRLKFSTSD